MKQILIILGLLASVTTFAQSPRIKLNQITKDTVKGSVLISSPSDSGMVYSRDFYIAYGADTVLILYGDTLAATSGIISSVLSDGVTITGNGTIGNELKVDTSLIVTINALNDSLATISASTTADGVTITGDGTTGNELKADTSIIATIKALNDSLATVSASTEADGVTITGAGTVADPLKVDTLLISTIQGLVDTLTARGYLTANQTITLSGDVTGSGTTAITATVVDDSHNHIISNVDFLQDSLNAKANDSDLANYVTLSGTDTITGAKTFTNTFTQSGGDANFDSGTLYVDESENRVGIGTSSPSEALDVNGEITVKDFYNLTSTGSTVGFRLYNQNNHRLSFENRNTDDISAFVRRDDGVFKNIFLFYYMTGRLRFRADTVVTDNLAIFEDDIVTNLGNGSSNQDLGVDLNGQLNIFTSDERLKQKTRDEVNAMDKIKLLNPLYYKWLDFQSMGTKEYFGFFAQDIQNVMPSAVYNVGQTDYYGYDKTAIIALNTKAIQEQQAIIETQQFEIEQLKTLITDLTNRLIILENK